MTQISSDMRFSPSSAAEDKLTDVKDAWNRAPDGPKKAVALKHYEAACRANSLKDHAICYRELEAAARALA